MLDEQFFGDKKYRKYLNDNFVAIHAYKNHPQAGEDLYANLRAKYKLIGTPTVLVAMADGTEIDRIVGFLPPADDFKKQVIEAYTSDETFLNLTKAYKKDPDNFDTQIKLANKLCWHSKHEFHLEILSRIASNPKAKSKIVPLGLEGHKESALEYAERTIINIKKQLDRKLNK